MQLTKLEIKGFKSFADKVTINFDEGITGIIGPNGCGKSNVVDSIRWVLGEQKTRALRSEKMENIIFNGTKNRKQTQLAEVSLTFSNTKNLIPTEYTQVTITRRYYRSGDSEYLLNGVQCRLKDITNLFLDTGIATNSYAIIELKMVDDILNDKDGSRRSLFEEAAGISKFKIRKKETLKKLNDTDADLDRVEDLLFEIEKNLKSLERQAKQAERYYGLKEDYKKFSITLAKKSVSNQRLIHDSLSKQLEEGNDRKLNFNKIITEKEAAKEQNKADLITREKLLSSRQKTLNEHVGKIRAYESEKKIKNERLRFLNDRVDNLREQIDQDKKSNERAEFSIKSLERERETADKILAEISAKLNVLQDEYQQQKSQTQEIQAKNNELNNLLSTRKEEVFQLNKTIEIKQIQQSTLKQELEKTAETSTEQTANLDQFDRKLKEISSLKEEKEEEYKMFKSKEEQLQTAIKSNSKTVELIKEELVQINRKLDARQNEYNLTKSLVDNLEGFPEAIKFLKKQQGWAKNAPLLSDVLTCPEEYRVTIEGYLEPLMNYYIVENEAQAYEAINLLSEGSKGKAHFFVLDQFVKYKPAASAIVPNGTPATEIVEYDEKYKKLITYILDNVYIAENNSIDDFPDSVIAITKNGKITRREFSFSGGSVGLFEGKRIGRAKNLEKLSETIKKLNKKLEITNNKLSEKTKELEELKKSSHGNQLEYIRDEVNKINQEYISIKTKQEQFASMLDSNINKREDIEEKLLILREELEEIQPRYEDIKISLESSEEEYLLIKDEVEAKTELLSQRSAAYNQENILFHQQQNKVGSITQEISFKQTNFNSSKERVEKNSAILKETEEEVRQLIQTSETNDDELVAMYDEKESIEKGVNEAEKDYYEARGNIDEIAKAIREIQGSRENIDSFLMEINNKLNESKLQLNSVKERLSVEFNVNLDEILNEPEPEEQEKEAEFTEQELTAKVEKIKSRLDNMGPINPMAMEAYQEIKERHDFIISQKEDLLKAKDSLMATIGEIDDVARVTFMEAFDKIKVNFIKVFRSLFTEEDDCDLRLADPERPLESAIEIMAKPKGKRPLTINQLSGGEKTLTATSLLFAIYLIKPAPFCIFDEVDAPLDDANIDKFNNIIRTFSKDSQFIIVTHNKRTMASTDIMYGITMREQGVSSVIPTDLRGLE